MSSVAIQRLLAELREQGITDQRTLDAIAAVPREAFVPPTFAERAWDNTALPIGFGQTISQPLVVASMTEALRVGPRMKVLEMMQNIYDDFVGDMVKAAAGIKIGDPRQADTVMGPLVSAAQRDRVERYVAKGRAEGATVACGGQRPAAIAKRFYYEPTLFTGAHNDMAIARGREWVEGLQLNQFVQVNIERRENLKALLGMWIRLCRRLRDAGIAHADLQHGNVLLVPGATANTSTARARATSPKRRSTATSTTGCRWAAWCTCCGWSWPAAASPICSKARLTNSAAKTWRRSPSMSARTANGRSIL